MVNNTTNNILIPNITKLAPKESLVTKNKKQTSQITEFEALLNSKNTSTKKNTGVQFSKHALKRIQERNMNVDSNEYLKLNDAIVRLKAKGGKESLVITDNGAYILDVNNSRVVTAMDKEQLKENVFTKIDSTLFLN